MRAARLYAAGDIRVEEIAAPTTPLPGWVGLRVTAAGICGSDIHNFRTGQWISRSRGGGTVPASATVPVESFERDKTGTVPSVDSPRAPTLVGARGFAPNQEVS